ncbi:response regulator [Paenibacillus sp. HN-1]|uniref:response regulator transcription factor n=1 Tax=Paenibacillus TaxID=44249 RepID=UPI001CA89F9D|nr:MULTISPECIES: response regulator [Paenibacillus]MBY9081749.1 response regulator [Paenibacillus sp. CGMCC 1.18879]MBY9083618.1 response regulator [Paenibacillus sinensis]
MLKAVVVDDERLVRKGFISLIDWASFGVVITGEAGDGASALALLREQDIDLLFVDITMPGMSGFELIRQIRQLYPGIRCVVLSCHHEFDFVQEALRLGAVDYIVKTLLEVGNADETIRRLVERIRWEDSSRELLVRGENGRFPADSALLYLPVTGAGVEEELFRISVVRSHRLIPMKGVWLSPLPQRMSEEELRQELNQELGGRWRTAIITGVKDRPYAELEEALLHNARRTLFYCAMADDPASLSLDDLGKPDAEGDARNVEEFLKDARLLKWTVDRRDWELFMARVGRLHLPAGDIASFAQGLAADWSGILLTPEEHEGLANEAAGCLSWCQWKSWLRRFADHVQRRMLELGFSREVLLCLIKATQYMRSRAGDKINQNQVAAYVNMSRGYFSQCFARFAGESFGEKLRGMRLELAKSLLLETDDPVSEIACKSGFEDDRYFSRFFRERVGKLPSQYRAEGMRP